MGNRDHTESKDGKGNTTQMRMGRPDTMEVSLCGRPAVQIATFLALKAAGRPRRKLGPQPAAEVTMGFPLQDVVRRQVFGYATAPWIYDADGDMLNPYDVEVAQNTFMKNLQFPPDPDWFSSSTGVGENHRKWHKTAYVVASAIDYTGSLGGIPGGWWFGVHITDAEVWEKCLDGTYNGFSVGAFVDWSVLGTENHLTDAAKALPNLAAIRAVTLKQNRIDGINLVGADGKPVTSMYTYPIKADDYADPANCRLPIDTVNRALAVFDYLTGPVVKTMDGYTKEEFKTVLKNVVDRLAQNEVGLPDAVWTKLGMTKPQTQKSLVIGLQPTDEGGSSGIDENDDVTSNNIPQQGSEKDISEPDDTGASVKNTQELDEAASAFSKFFNSFKQALTVKTEVIPKEESDMTPEEIQKMIQEGLTKTVATALPDLIAKSMADIHAANAETARKAEEAAAVAQKTEEEKTAALVETIVAKLAPMLTKGEESTPSLQDQYTEALKAMQGATEKVMELSQKMGDIAPGQLSANMMTAGAVTPDLHAFKATDFPSVVLRDEDTGVQWQTTKEDYEFALKWAETEKFDADPIEENLRAAAIEGLLPSQKRR